MKRNLLLRGGVHNLALAESVELTGGRDRVSTHVLKVEPIARLQKRQARL